MQNGAFTDPKYFGYLGGMCPNDHIVRGHNRYRKITGATDDKVTIQNKSGKKAKSVKIDKLRKRGARAAIQAGGDIGAKVAAERPVMAAKMRDYESPEAREKAIEAAYADPNSHRSEKRAKRQAARGGKWSVASPSTDASGSYSPSVGGAGPDQSNAPAGSSAFRGSNMSSDQPRKGR